MIAYCSEHMTKPQGCSAVFCLYEKISGFRQSDRCNMENIESYVDAVTKAETGAAMSKALG